MGSRRLASREAMGISQMDLAARLPTARAGYEQGKRDGAGMRLM